MEEVVERRKKLVQRSLRGRFEQICTYLRYFALLRGNWWKLLILQFFQLCVAGFVSLPSSALGAWQSWQITAIQWKCNEHWIAESTSTISLRLGLPALHFCSVRATTVFEPQQQGARDAKRIERVAVCSGIWWFGWHTVIHFMVHGNSLGSY